MEFGYDANGNRDKVVPPGRSAHRFEYDRRDRLDVYRPPAVGGTQMPTDYHYNDDGDLIRIDYPDGATLRRIFDSAGRLDEAQAPVADRDYTYDGQTGRVDEISSTTGQTVGFTFDGPLCEQTTWSGLVSGTVHRTFDDSFRVASRSVNQSHRVSFGYDADSRVTQAGGMTITRDPDTGFVETTEIGVVKTRRTYNDHGELKTHTAKVRSRPTPCRETDDQSTAMNRPPEPVSWEPAALKRPPARGVFACGAGWWTRYRNGRARTTRPCRPT